MYIYIYINPYSFISFHFLSFVAPKSCLYCGTSVSPTKLNLFCSSGWSCYSWWFRCINVWLYMTRCIFRNDWQRPQFPPRAVESPPLPTWSPSLLPFHLTTKSKATHATNASKWTYINPSLLRTFQPSQNHPACLSLAEGKDQGQQLRPLQTYIWKRDPCLKITRRPPDSDWMYRIGPLTFLQTLDAEGFLDDFAIPAAQTSAHEAMEASFSMRACMQVKNNFRGFRMISSSPSPWSTTLHDRPLSLVKLWRLFRVW